MKFRVIGLVLAIATGLSLTLTAFASTGTNENVDSGVVYVDTSRPTVPQYGAQETSDAPFCLDGVPMDALVYQVQNKVNYVTVESFVTALDREAVVEEECGVVTVNAVAVADVVDVVVWEVGSDNAAEANVEDEVLDLTARVGAYYVEANGRCLYVEDGVITVEGKVALPIRVLAKVFNLDVAYDSESQTVQLKRQEGASAYLADAESYYNSDTLYWLSHIIHAESGNQSLAGKLAVGNVVMNRVEHPDFPDSIYDVLFQKNQFSPAASGSIYREPNAESVVAAKLVLDGAEVLEDALFFNRAGMNTRAARTRTHVATIGAHSFYA